MTMSLSIITFQPIPFLNIMQGGGGFGLIAEYPATLKQLHGFLAKTLKESLFRFLQRPASRPVLTYGKRLYFRSQRQLT